MLVKMWTYCEIRIEIDHNVMSCWHLNRLLGTTMYTTVCTYINSRGKIAHEGHHEHDKKSGIFLTF